jgi:hypothetical protein
MIAGHLGSNRWTEKFGYIFKDKFGFTLRGMENTCKRFG